MVVENSLSSQTPTNDVKNFPNDVDNMSALEIIQVLRNLFQEKYNSAARRTFAEKLLQALESSLPEKPATENNQSSASTADTYPETYAEKVKKGPHTVLLYPTQNTDEQGAERNKAFSVKHFLESSIHLLKDKIKIKDVRKIRNQGLSFDCEDDCDVQKILSSIQNKEELKKSITHLQPTKIATILLKASQKHQPDSFIVQEPHVKDGKIAGIPKCWKSWLSKGGKAGIIAFPACSTPVVLSAKENSMAIKITKNSKAFTIISSHSSPYANFREILEELTDLTTNINGEEYLIGGDFNAHSQRWGYRDEDSRGKQLQEFIAEKHIILLNSSESPPTGMYLKIDLLPSLSLFSNISETLLDTLRNRKVAMQTSEGPVLWEQTQGYPQGSCSGPAFWNVVADEILSVQWPQRVHLQAFADDFAFIVTDNTRESLRKLSKFALDKFKD
ncbi:hypothetical protein AVEN_258247-1 [Araneus ventricosus]|uniref:Endonuclease/exonuclease/phosphatase domain-containing protein n=1 Tax=Araneus ventricosus TaxID=182803 RepID=A0A4Y2M926_ARAVE|nr:hypothetical protein AVEN_258247-1 [Araneus ventricosus]